MTSDPATPQPEPLRERILAATLAALLDLDTPALVSAVGLREIARRAGASPASVVYHFGSVEGLAEAVLDHVFGGVEARAEEVAVGILSVVRSQLPVQAALSLHTAEFQRITGDPELALRMGLWAFGGQQGADRYHAYLRGVDDQARLVLEALVEHWGREVRPPFDVDTVLAAHTALVNGHCIRAGMAPDLVDARRHALAATALSMTILRVRGDSRDMDDRLAEVNYYPLENARTGAPVTGRAETTRARLLAAAAELFAVRGFDDTSIAQIARVAGVGTSTLHQHFATKQRLAIALFRKQAEDALLRARRTDAAPSDPLRAHLGAIVDFARTHLDITEPYLADLACHGPVAPGEDLVRERLADLVATAGPSATTAADGVPSFDRAHLALVVLLTQLLGAPATPTEAIVEQVWSAFFADRPAGTGQVSV